MTITDDPTDFQVDRSDISATEFVPSSITEDSMIDEGQILLRLVDFALTANNISYASTGEFLGYWSFFPADNPSKGRIPVWGFADVVRSNHPDIAEGERIFGIWPVSHFSVLTPEAVDRREFTDAAAHRAALHPWYSRYFRCAADPVYDRSTADIQPVFWALFMTGWLLAESLAANGHFGASRVVVASASSKTAYSFAHSMQARSPSIEIVGLTSASNVDFVERLGCYDRVVSYDELPALTPEGAAIFVDMAGNGQVRHTVHELHGDDLVHSVLVGGTHQGAGATDEPLAGATPQFFFVPDEAEARSSDWGRDQFIARFADAWKRFAAADARFVEVDHRQGMEEVASAYSSVLGGDIPPDRAVIVTL